MRKLYRCDIGGEHTRVPNSYRTICVFCNEMMLPKEGTVALNCGTWEGSHKNCLDNFLCLCELQEAEREEEALQRFYIEEPE